MKTPPNSTTKIPFILSVLAILLGLISIYNSTRSNLKIAYVNTAKLMQDYKAIRDAQEKLKSKTSEFQSNVDTLTVELQRGILDYEKKRASMSAKEQKLAEELLMQKKSQLDQYQQATQQKTQQEDAKITQEVISGVNEYIQEYGKEHHYKLIFATTNGNIVYGTDALDITKEIVDGLNSKYTYKLK